MATDNFGAFVFLTPGRAALCISPSSPKVVQKVTDVVTEVAMVKVKVLEVGM